jgi:3-phosphoshikimate 1-carboxyvinyltransferase
MEDRYCVKPSRGLKGDMSVPGDKSISHRSILLGALAEETSRISGFLSGSDCLATLSCLRDLGCSIDIHDNEITIQGVGVHGLKRPEKTLDCVRSGTTMRLLIGLMAGQTFDSQLSGDDQLLRRPMGRVAEPLRMMGAEITTTDGKAPLFIKGKSLHGIKYPMPVASAQVKSALLLAGLYADSPTTIIEKGPSRDHTERMLSLMGADIQVNHNKVTIIPTEQLHSISSGSGSVYQVPGDISSAAFLITALCLVPSSSGVIRNVGVNPTRTGILDVLTAMGAGLHFDNSIETKSNHVGEPRADIFVRSSRLQGRDVDGDMVVRMIDEFPIFAVAATQASGRTTVREAAELRVKETDRIATVVEELQKLGAAISATADGFIVEGGKTLKGGKVSSHGDHRLAMALTVAGLIAEGEVCIDGVRCIDDSFPGFLQRMRKLGAEIS